MGGGLMKLSLGAVVSVLGILVGVAGLSYGWLKDRDAMAEERGALKALVLQLEKQVTEHRQLIEDTRARLASAEHRGRYLHGEFAPR